MPKLLIMSLFIDDKHKIKFCDLTYLLLQVLLLLSIFFTLTHRSTTRFPVSPPPVLAAQLQTVVVVILQQLVGDTLVTLRNYKK